ncbi:MAG: hypothetical protein WCD11_30470, partial [Solirubrobacteraceae bacterium]
ATLERLRAPGIAARSGVTLGGETFGTATATGVLPGRFTGATVRPTKGAYVLQLPESSAAMLTLAAPALR